MTAMKKNEKALKWASERLKDDEEVVAVAIKNSKRNKDYVIGCTSKRIQSELEKNPKWLNKNEIKRRQTWIKNHGNLDLLVI